MSNIAQRSPITTHVLDTSKGRPASEVKVELEFYSAAEWRAIGSGITNTDGRIEQLLTADYRLADGQYRLRFDTGRYFSGQKAQTFFPEVTIVFTVDKGQRHYHVPLLLSPFGYSTYRGS
jgi:5-hydroxyisourate hydrolase